MTAFSGSARGALRLARDAFRTLALCGCAGLVPAADLCHPEPDGQSAQYVIGYGSLMQELSRKRAAPQAGPAMPVDVAGYRRGWFLRSAGAGLGTTFLAAVPDTHASLNAVAYRVQPTELAATDRREESYCRAQVPVSGVRWLAPGGSSADGDFWIYVVDERKTALPSARFPIAQSYVDVFIGGCLEQEERFGIAGFSTRCVRSTSGWSTHWVNDRVYPRRPFIFEPRARRIDELLASEVFEKWSKSRVEGNDRRAR